MQVSWLHWSVLCKMMLGTEAADACVNGNTTSTASNRVMIAFIKRLGNMNSASSWHIADLLREYTTRQVILQSRTVIEDSKRITDSSLALKPSVPLEWKSTLEKEEGKIGWHNIAADQECWYHITAFPVCRFFCSALRWTDKYDRITFNPNRKKKDPGRWRELSGAFEWYAVRCGTE